MITANDRRVQFIIAVNMPKDCTELFVEKVKRSGMINATQRVEAAKRFDTHDDALNALYRIDAQNSSFDIKEILVNTTVYYRNTD